MCNSSVLLSAVSLFVVVWSGSDPMGARAADEANQAIRSRVEKTDSGDVFVIQEATIQVPVQKVWDAYTTSVGWRAWVAPVAEVQFQIGGVIRTNYRADGAVNDPDANTLHIVNYVPLRVLTLQAQVSKNWPEVLKEQEKQMYNVLTFEAETATRTKVTSYGIGYRDTPEFQKLLDFFIPANEATLQKLIAYLERGETAFQ